MPSIQQEYNTLPIYWRPSVDQILKKYVTPIWNSRKRIELLFSSMMKCDGIFKFSPNDPIANNIFIKPCKSEKDFIDKVLNLAAIITNLKEKTLKRSVKNTRSRRRKGSLNLFEAFLKERYPNSDLSAIQTLRDIQRLRSKSFPVHETGVEYLKAIRRLGIEFPPDDWQVAWETVLEKCKDAFEKIESLLK